MGYHDLPLHVGLIWTKQDRTAAVGRSNQGIRLSELVNKHWHTDCLYPRDTRYALLGLALAQPFQADYEKPPAALFWDVYCTFRSEERRVDSNQLIRALRLNTRDMKTLIFCLVVTRRVRQHDHSVPSTWLMQAEQSVRNYYDEVLINWFQCPHGE